MMQEEVLLGVVDDLTDVLTDGEYKLFMDLLGNWYNYQKGIAPIMERLHPRVSRCTRLLRRRSLKSLASLVGSVVKRRSQPLCHTLAMAAVKANV